MKMLIKCMLIGLFLFSCKKEKELTNNPISLSSDKKYPVTFNVSDFSRQVVGSTKGPSISEVPLQGNAGYLTYIAFNSAGQEVSRIKQDSTGLTFRTIEFGADEKYLFPLNNEAFGSINDTLSPGNYTIVMIASQSLFSINHAYDPYDDRNVPIVRPFNEASFYFNPLLFYNGGEYAWSRAKDTFFKKINVTIAETNPLHTVTLDRIVGKAVINVLDSRPGTTLKFLFVNENEAFKFSDEQPFGITNDLGFINNIDSVAGKANLSYSKFIINTATPLDVIINVYENGTLSASKTVKGVRFYKNKRTILTGNIYSASPVTTGFNVTVNNEFDEDTEEVEF